MAQANGFKYVGYIGCKGGGQVVVDRIGGLNIVERV
jgi:hypothetical protein